jgi:hypothetical protein
MLGKAWVDFLGRNPLTCSKIYMNEKTPCRIAVVSPFLTLLKKNKDNFFTVTD